jgi:hypothetical protein
MGGEIVYKDITPMTYIHEVERQFFEARLNGSSRLSEQWDTFSRKINQVSRKKQAQCRRPSTAHHCWNLAFGFWVNCSQALSAYNSKKPLAFIRAKKLQKLNQKIKKEVAREWGDRKWQKS